MEPSIRHGDKLLVSENIKLEAGRIVIATHDDAWIVKRLVLRDGGLVLRSDNADEEVALADVDEAGHAVGSQREGGGRAAIPMRAVSDENVLQRRIGRGLHRAARAGQRCHADRHQALLGAGGQQRQEDRGHRREAHNLRIIEGAPGARHGPLVETPSFRYRTTIRAWREAHMMARIAYEHRGALGVPFARSRGLTEGDLETLYAAGAEAVRLLAEERPHPLLMDGGMLMTRWKRFPERAMAEDMAGKLTRAARRFSRGAGDIVSVGIGGSYLGGAAVVQALTHSQSAMAAKARGRAPRVHFLGEQLDPDLIAEKLEALDPDRTAVIVISKSGTTTETAVMFRLMADWLGPARMRERLVAVTDARSGALREAVRRYGLNGCIDADLAPFFNVPDGIGGRFSALTAAGLFAVAAAGIDVEALLVGARCAEEEWCRRPEPAANMALRRAAVRAAFKRAVEGKAYESVLYFTGQKRRHYAMNNDQEYFAELLSLIHISEPTRPY